MKTERNTIIRGQITTIKYILKRGENKVSLMVLKELSNMGGADSIIQI